MIGRIMVSLAAVLVFSLAPQQVQAAPELPQQLKQFAACSGGLEDFLGLEPWYACLEKKYGEVKITDLNDIWLIVLPVLESIIRAAGYIAVGFIFWGGIKYSKSQGNPSETGQALDVIRNAVIGLLWVVLSVAVIEFVTTGIQAGTSSGATPGAGTN